MKKVLGVAVCALGIFAAAGDAEAARHRFWGGMVITAATAICSGEVNQKFAVRFRAAGLGDGTTSTITLFRHDSARHFEVNGLFNSSFKPATTTDVFDYVGPADIPASIKFSAQSPASITTTTLNIVVTGQIKGWDSIPTCTLTFRMVLTKRVES